MSQRFSFDLSQLFLPPPAFVERDVLSSDCHLPAVLSSIIKEDVFQEVQELNVRIVRLVSDLPLSKLCQPIPGLRRQQQSFPAHPVHGTESAKPNLRVLGMVVSAKVSDRIDAVLHISLHTASLH